MIEEGERLKALHINLSLKHSTEFLISAITNLT